MRIMSKFRDHQDERTYYYGVVRHSDTSVSYADLQEAAGGAGRTVNLASEGSREGVPAGSDLRDHRVVG